MAVSNNYEIKVYILDGVAVQFAIPFDVNVDDYGHAINVVVNLGLDELEKDVDYTISGKTINYPGAVDHAGEKLTVFRRTPIEQPVDFVDNGNFTLEDIETGLDRSIMIEQETSANLDNTILAQTSAERAEQYKDIAIEKASDAEDWAVGTRSDGQTPAHSLESAKHYAESADTSASMATSMRNQSAASALESEGWAVGKQGGVDVPGTSPYYHNNSKYYSDYASSTVGAHSTALTYLDSYSGNVDTVAGMASDISAVASNSTNINAVAGDLTDIGTVASDITDISTVAAGMTNINLVAGDLTNVDTVAGDIADVATVAGDITNVNTVANSATNIDAVASNETNINTVASNVSSVGTVASNMSSVTSVAGNATNINKVASDITDVSSVAGKLTDISTVAGIGGSVTTVAGISSNVTSVAGDLTNIDAVANNITNVNTVATNVSDVSTVATNVSDVGTVATNMSDINTVVTNLTGILAADDYASLSRQYDEGKKLDGTDVTSGEEGYQNNAKYWAAQAASHAINSIPYGVSSTAAATVQKEVSIPEVTTLNDGQVIVIKPTVTSSVASSTIKLNDFPAYKMLYNAAEITTSTDSVVWSANIPSMWVLDDVSGTKYWRFLGHGLDSNTTYTVNYSIDAGTYVAGTGTYAITRYSICAMKPDGKWEKITATNANYSTGTTKSVNTSGFVLNQLRYYSTTTTVAGGSKASTNTMYEKAASVTMSYSLNCGTAPSWTTGLYIYLVGTMGADGLFYLDTTQWWATALPSTNDGKLYIRLGKALTTTDSTMSFFSDRPIFYHDGTSVKLYTVTPDNPATLKNKTIDYTDNTIKNTPAVVSSSQTISPTKDTQVIIDTASTVLTLGTAPYAGYELPVLLLADASITYTGIGGTYTDQVLANRKLTYTYTGSAWFCSSAPEIGSMYQQLPAGEEPAKMYGGQWVERNYSGRFFRPNGGNAEAFSDFDFGELYISSTNTVQGNGPTFTRFLYMVGGNMYANANAGTSTADLTITGTFPAEWVGTYKRVVGIASQEQSLPNITGQIQPVIPDVGFIQVQNESGALSNLDTGSVIKSVSGASTTAGKNKGIKFDASKSNSTYGASNEVRVHNITIKIWERTA